MIKKIKHHTMPAYGVSKKKLHP